MSDDAIRGRNLELMQVYGGCLSARDAQGAAKLMTEDVTYQAVYYAPGMPPIVRGRAGIVRMIERLGEITKKFEASDVLIWTTQDPNVIFQEMTVHQDFYDGGTYDNRVIVRWTFRDGLLAGVLEYSGLGPWTELARRCDLEKELG